jgi:hypothetical protein
VDGLDPVELTARLRSLRALCQIFCGSKHPMVRALAMAETGDPAAMQEAWELLERMPARSRRHVLASLAELMKQTPTRERKTG